MDDTHSQNLELDTVHVQYEIRTEKVDFFKSSENNDTFL